MDIGKQIHPISTGWNRKQMTLITWCTVEKIIKITDSYSQVSRYNSDFMGNMGDRFVNMFNSYFSLI